MTNSIRSSAVGAFLLTVLGNILAFVFTVAAALAVPVAAIVVFAGDLLGR